MIRVNDVLVDHEWGLTVEALLTRQGYAAAMVAVWIDEVFVARAVYDQTLVPDGSVVEIVLMAPGG